MLIAIVERALAKDPSKRFRSAEDLSRALTAYLAHTAHAGAQSGGVTRRGHTVPLSAVAMRSGPVSQPAPMSGPVPAPMSGPMSAPMSGPMSAPVSMSAPMSAAPSTGFSQDAITIKRQAPQAPPDTPIPDTTPSGPPPDACPPTKRSGGKGALLAGVFIMVGLMLAVGSAAVVRAGGPSRLYAAIPR